MKRNVPETKMSDLAGRIRSILSGEETMKEVRMFGGLCFMLDGNMLVCTTKNGSLLARVGSDAMEAALRRPGATRMAMGGRDMKDFVAVAPERLGDDALRDWIVLATDFVSTLPAKASKARGRRN